jgi:predicted O-methyltransferase YrrM
MDIYSKGKEALANYPRAKAVAVLVRRWIRKLYDPVKGTVDRRRLGERYPGLEEEVVLRDEFPRELASLYDEYTLKISNRVMAISLELAVVIYALCKRTRPMSILDLGSGYSSVVFLHYAKHHERSVTVVTVDDSADWLAKTQRYLGANDLPIDGMTDWASFTKGHPERYDLVFYDLGHVRGLRKDAFELILDYVKPGGIVILDDMNFMGYKRHVKRVLKGKKFESYSAEGISSDSLGRYPYLLVAE